MNTIGSVGVAYIGKTALKAMIKEHDMLNWLKANRKVMNKGEMKEERVERFRELMEMCERYRRKNQYV